MPTEHSLSQGVILVTGASQDVGRRIASRLAGTGARIALNYYADAHGAKALLDEIRSDGGRALLAPGSVRDAEGAWRVTQFIEQQWAQIDVLVHTAALLDGDEQVEDPGPLLTELLPGMRQRGWGRIILISPTDGPITLLPAIPDILINTIWVSPAEHNERLDETIAHLTLLLLNS